MSIDDLKNSIRDIHDFPHKGIIFKDITPVLQDKELFKYSIGLLVEKVKEINPDFICGIESRGFIFGSTVALELNKGFVPVRKPGKLPYDTFKMKYELEYGSNILEIHKDAFFKEARVVIIDDLLATGGTAKASAKLVEACGAIVVQILFLIELSFLKGREALKGYLTDTILRY